MVTVAPDFKHGFHNEQNVIFFSRFETFFGNFWKESLL